jgi:hypothetical protein
MSRSGSSCRPCRTDRGTTSHESAGCGDRKEVLQTLRLHDLCLPFDRLTRCRTRDCRPQPQGDARRSLDLATCHAGRTSLSGSVVPAVRGVHECAEAAGFKDPPDGANCQIPAPAVYASRPLSDRILGRLSNACRSGRNGSGRPRLPAARAQEQGPADEYPLSTLRQGGPPHGRALRDFEEETEWGWLLSDELRSRHQQAVEAAVGQGPAELADRETPAELARPAARGLLRGLPGRQLLRRGLPSRRASGEPLPHPGCRGPPWPAARRRSPRPSSPGPAPAPPAPWVRRACGHGAGSWWWLGAGCGVFRHGWCGHAPD